MIPNDIIRIKRNKREIPAVDLKQFIWEYSHQQISDKDMTKLLKAIFKNGMTREEIFALTESMIASGEKMDFSFLSNYVADKHSTGGVGDKVSIILGPLMAAAGLAVPMISGRSLGHTGGTLDKLETIPGYRTNISLDEFRRNVNDIGISMIGQTKEICPADRKMYALRDVTGTVASIPLICGSIMSKKIAEGIEGLVMDIKIGNGAFMKTIQEGKELAALIRDIGENFNVKCDIVFTSMDQPLGRYAGLWCEIKEAIDCLRNEGSDDTMEVTFALGTKLLLQAQIVSDENEALNLQQQLIESGHALEKFLKMVAIHDGSLSDIASLHTLHLPKEETVLSAEKPGYITNMNTLLIGLAHSELGCGRKKLSDNLDPTAGIEFYHKIGDQVLEGEPLMRLFNTDKEKLDKALKLLKDSVEIDENKLEHHLILDDNKAN
jgi:pyrimidine-nucleoside phosphorylase